MHGMVNKALQQMVTARCGERVWEVIIARAGIETEVFISNKNYEDEVTYLLVKESAEYLGVHTDRLLEDFGEYWVLETARRGYGGLMNSAGANIKEFLTNLPDFHARVMMIFPDLKPPEFTLLDAGESMVLMRYSSHRAGLGPFVKGLMIGLGKLYGVALRVDMTPCNTPNGCDVKVEW